jgi:serine/threonine protein kinase
MLVSDHGSVLGSGFFGKVYTGRLRQVTVAVKTIKADADRFVIKSFLQEIEIRSYLGSHTNIVQFLGANTDSWQKERKCDNVCKRTKYICSCPTKLLLI